MKTLQVMAGGADGGAEIAFVDFCIALAETGTGVVAVTRGNNPARVQRLRDAGIETYILPFGGWVDLYTPIALRRIVRTVRPDIVQTWMARAAQKVTRWNPAMNIPRYAVVSRLGNRYKLKNFRQTDAFVAITPDIKTWLESQGVPTDRVRHINNFAETETAAASANRAAENTPADAKLALALGRLHRAKAFDVLLDAMTHLPDVYLWIAGEGPERTALERQIADLNLGDRVRLLGWRDDRAALLQAADLFVLPSRFEPFGTVFVQAWANKIPLVTTDADGPRQFVRQGEDGIVVPREDPLSLAAAMRRIVDNEDYAQNLTKAGYQRYLFEFTREMILDQYVLLYRNMYSEIAM